MIAQTVTLVNVPVSSQPVSRVRKWNRAAGRYEWAVVTQQQVEADKRRAAYIQEYNPCGVM